MTTLSTLEFLQRHIENNLPVNAITEMCYPTAISKLLDFRIIAIAKGQATLSICTDPNIHGNQQGTVHGGLLSELADAAIGTAHSTAIKKGESFTSIDLHIKFFRPVWKSTLTATVCPVKLGQTISHYQCEITRENSDLVALASGTIMTLRGDSALGR
ncbi:PaaI family thioesterase [Neptuniibacter pectenicola]|uniref:PaaI family thioesterase n=1 Tax=Neptuniibacter pectenicola TaxID=1806669 RepID=UPI0030ECCEC7|tara:strand:- start:880 stop:1353 length:474 start_codon:yes stop_codon:yes gene_type:complete